MTTLPLFLCIQKICCNTSSFVWHNQKIYYECEFYTCYKYHFKNYGEVKVFLQVKIGLCNIIRIKLELVGAKIKVR